MTPQFPHDVLSRPSADEAGREGFLAAMRRFLITDLYDGNEVAYRRRQEPAFAKTHGRPPATYLEVKSLMERDPFYRSFSLLNRATQELLWDTVGESVERQTKTLADAARSVPSAGGTLTLDPDFRLPQYATKVDIHVMPGSFHKELGGEDDLYAGAVYDRGVYIYAYGGLGERNEGLGQGTAEMVKERFPTLRPRRILDMGCGAGMSTLPLAAVFPEAEIYAIDIAAPMLRYAHARSEALGVPVHYAQRSAAATGYADGSFDLVISNLLLHEIPQKLTREILVECHRLLSSGRGHRAQRHGRLAGRSVPGVHGRVEQPQQQRTLRARERHHRLARRVRGGRIRAGGCVSAASCGGLHVGTTRLRRLSWRAASLRPGGSLRARTVDG